MAKAKQRAYIRVMGLSLMDIQKAVNQLCDWIFQLESGGGGSGAGATDGVGTATQIFMPLPNLNLGLSPQQAPGTTITLTPGKWLVIGFFFFEFGAINGFVYGGLTVNGSGLPYIVEMGLPLFGAEKFCAERTWLLDLPSGANVNLFAGHTNNTAGCFLIAGQTSIMAVRVS